MSSKFGVTQSSLTDNQSSCDIEHAKELDIISSEAAKLHSFKVLSDENESVIVSTAVQ